jgi:ABC-type transporter Mla subunit MlaD
LYLCRSIHRTQTAGLSALFFSLSSQAAHSNHIAATETTSEAVNRAIKELRETAELATQSAAEAIGRTLKELQDTTHGAVEQSKQTTSAAVSEMQETHNMLRADTTALYERLRQANILLQEVLSGAHENMSDIESTLVARVADFVAAMNDVAQKAGAANSDVERNIAGFKEMSTTTLNDLSQIAGQFDAHACSLAEAVASLDGSNRQSESALAERRSSLEQLMSTVDSKAGVLEERLTRFAGVLD